MLHTFKRQVRTDQQNGIQRQWTKHGRIHAPDINGESPQRKRGRFVGHRDGRIDEGSAIEYLYEPDPATLFTQLIPTHVEVQVFRALLESNAAFYAAQMTAMDSATRNSAEMIGNLTLYMNKIRQAAITREIIEVVSGAEAL